MTARYSSTDYYELLLLGDDFTPEELEASYGRMLELHDPSRKETEEEQLTAQGLLEQVEEAYRTLSDTEARREYDAWLIESDIRKRRENNGGARDIFIPESRVGDIFFQGLCDLEERKLEEAALRFRLALEKEPEFHAARCLLGRVLVLIGGPGAAEGRREIRRALDAEPSVGILIPSDELDPAPLPTSPTGDPSPAADVAPAGGATTADCYCVAASGAVIFAVWDGALSALKRRAGGRTETLAKNFPHRVLSLKCSADGTAIALEARTPEGKALFALEDGALTPLA